MDSEKVYPLVRHNLIPIILGCLGLVLVVLGLFQLMSGKESRSPLVLEEEEGKEQEIVIDIGGAVIKPGVYKLTQDSRTVDALAAAGGLSEDADRVWVEKNINLAGKLSDGLKIYIPRAGEEILSGSSQSSQSQGTSGPVLNINTASMSDLEALPGIGEVTANKIIGARPFSSPEELLNRKVVGQATYEKIKDLISAN